MERHKSEFDWMRGDMIVNMVGLSSGNPGAATVLAKMVEDNPDRALLAMMHLDTLRFRGSEIWVGYKDICNEDISEFAHKVCLCDDEMFEYMRKEGGLS